MQTQVHTQLYLDIAHDVCRNMCTHFQKEFIVFHFIPALGAGSEVGIQSQEPKHLKLGRPGKY